VAENGSKVLDQLTYEKLDKQIEPKLNDIEYAIKEIAGALNQIANELHTMKLLLILMIVMMLFALLFGGKENVFAQLQQVLSVHVPS